VPVAGQVATEHRNSGKRKGHGAEIEATWQALDNLKFTANYAFQRARDTLVDDDVGEAPNHQVYGRAEWRAFDHWHLNAQVNWAGEQKRVAADTRDPATKIRNIQTCFNVLGTELYCEHTSTHRHIDILRVYNDADEVGKETFGTRGYLPHAFGLQRD